MRNAESLIPFLAAVVALLGYIVLLLRKVSRSIGWFRKLPREHEWLMEQVKANTAEIRRVMEILQALIEKG